MNKSKILKGTLAGTLAMTIVGSAVYSSNALVYDTDLEDKTVTEPESWGALPHLRIKNGEMEQNLHLYSILQEILEKVQNQWLKH